MSGIKSLPCRRQQAAHTPGEGAGVRARCREGEGMSLGLKEQRIGQHRRGQSVAGQGSKREVFGAWCPGPGSTDGEFRPPPLARRRTSKEGKDSSFSESALPAVRQAAAPSRTLLPTCRWRVDAESAHLGHCRAPGWTLTLSVILGKSSTPQTSFLTCLMGVTLCCPGHGSRVASLTARRVEVRHEELAFENESS